MGASITVQLGGNGSQVPAVAPQIWSTRRQHAPPLQQKWVWGSHSFPLLQVL